MSASAWDRAVEASVAALNREEWSANLPGYFLSETILAAALPVLLEELAQRIAGVVPYGFELNYDGTEERERAAYLEGVHDAYDLVQGFTAEVTQ